MQMLNNIDNNNFGTLKQFKTNVIEIDNCFWNLNMNLKKILYSFNPKKLYIHQKLQVYWLWKFNGRYTIQQYAKKNYIISISKSELFVTNVIN